MRTRDELLAWLRDEREVGVLIVGGGINGAGVLRDLAAQVSRRCWSSGEISAQAPAPRPPG